MSVELVNKQINRFLGISTPAFCMDDCLATLAQYLKVDYSYVYYNALEYEYSNSDLKNGIGDGINVCFDLYANVKNIMGLEIDIQGGNLHQHMERINESLNCELPVLIEVYGNRWSGDWRYNTDIDGSHAFWITELSNGKCKIADPYYEQYESDVDVERLEKAFRSIGLLKKNKSKENTPAQQTIESALQDNIIKQRTMLEIEKDIKDENLLKKTLFSSEIDNVDNGEWKFDPNGFSNKIRQIVYNHVRFANFVGEYIEQQELLEQILMVAQKWNRVLMYIMKLTNTKSINTEKIDKLNKRISECVELDFKNINDIINNNKKEKDIIVNDEHNDKAKFTCLDLEQYYNNQAIGRNKRSVGEFNETGDYIKEESLKLGENVFWNEIEFSLSSNKDCKDNIITTGNDIIINKNINKIAFLCCACDEIVRDEINIIYENGTKDSKYIVFYDCVPEWNAKKNGDVVVSCMKSLVRNGKEIDEELAYLYGIIILMNGKKVAKIHLPDNENIHIFAISIM